MALLQYYGVLATTASIFLGILTAYLVTRFSDLKSERARLRRRIESIDGELEVLKARHKLRTDQLEETEDQWEQEDAERDVDRFIDHAVGHEWNPSPSDATVDNALDAMIEYRGLTEDDVSQYHIDLIEERWEDVVDELQPRGFFQAPNIPIKGEMVPLIRTLWNIYEREKYDSKNTEVTDIRRRADELENEREVLEEQYASLDPKQLKDSIKATAVPIVLSVVLPLVVRFLHELGWVLNVSHRVAIIEPLIVLIAWLIGFGWTVGFVWIQINAGDEGLPESPLVQEELGE